jgi:3-isopropylmalate dehydrogenase
MPSACIGTEKSYYEPSHGSAPDIAGQGVANPYSMIGSVALMLEKSFGMDAEAKRIWDAMRNVFGQGFTTRDLGDPDGQHQFISTAEFGDKVVEALKS